MVAMYCNAIDPLSSGPKTDQQREFLVSVHLQEELGNLWSKWNWTDCNSFPPAGHTGRLLQSLCFTSMSFLLLHIVYQITVNSLLAWNSIASNFSCEYTAAFVGRASGLQRFAAEESKFFIGRGLKTGMKLIHRVYGLDTLKITQERDLPPGD